MATVADWLDKLKAKYPGFWASLSAAQQDTLRTQMKANLDAGGTFQEYASKLESRPIYTNWNDAQRPSGDGGTGGAEPAKYNQGFFTEELASRYGTYWATLSAPEQQALSDKLWATAPRDDAAALAGFIDTSFDTNTGYQDWKNLYETTTGNPVPPPNAPPVPPGGNVPPPGGTGTTTPPPAPANSNLLAQITSLLGQWGLPASLAGFIQGEITASKGYDEIINDLRATPEYKAAFPENALRLAKGFSAMSEQQILEYRDQAKQIATSMLGINATDAQIANLIASNKSLNEWASNLQTYASFERWGPSVKQALSQELGYDVTDEQAFAFMSPDIPTPELDMAYTKALLRGQPAVLGFGIRPEQEAEILLQHGIDPQQAFAGYQGIAAELPREQRLQMIDAAINGTNTPDAQTAIKDASFNQLFKAIQLRDPAAINELSLMIARETSRWQSGGGAALSGTQSVGLLTPAERAAG